MPNNNNNDSFSYPEVNDTPETEKYLKHSAFWQKVGEPLARRAAWFGSLLLSAGASVPLTAKFAANGIIGLLGRDVKALQNAGENLGGAIALPVVIGGVSLASTLVPEQTGSKLVKRWVYQAPINFKANCKVSDNKRSIAEEVGPRVTPQETEAWHNYFSTEKLIKLPPTRTFPEVKGKNGIVIDTMDIPYCGADPNKVEKYRLCFNTSFSYYQKQIETIIKQQSKIKAHTRLFNYPGISKAGVVTSTEDLINAGIAEVYDLAKRNQWSNADLSRNLHLYSYCSGGLFATQVALYFKQKHNVDLTIFVDRCYSSWQGAIAREIHDHCGLPMSYGKLLAGSVLYATGDFNVNAEKAIEKLNPAFVNYINIAPDPVTNSATQIRKALRLSHASQKGSDGTIPDKAMLAIKLQKTNKLFGMPTTALVHDQDNKNGHFIYAEGWGHRDDLNNLFLKPPVASQKREDNPTVLDYYAKTLEPRG